MSAYTSTSYNTVINYKNTRCYTSMSLVVLSELVTLTISNEISIGEIVTLGTLDSYHPAQPTPISIWVNSTSTRRFMGNINTDGAINIRCNEKLGTGVYYIYIQCVYID